MTRPGVMVVHPGGPRNTRGLLAALEGANRLDRFVTTLGWPRTPSYLPASIRDRLGRRDYPMLPWRRFRWAPWQELARQAFGTPSIDAVYHAVDRRAARLIAGRNPGASAVYGYEDGALASFIAARRRGIPTIYELPAPYWRAVRAVSAAEAVRNPEWRTALPALADSAAKNARKDQEIAAADRIVVASEYARRTLDLVTAPVAVIGYGAPPPRQAPPSRPRNRRLRALYVGNLNQQKGLSYLLDAVRLAAVELTLVGKSPSEPCEPLRQALTTHRHRPPVGHAHVLNIMAEHDVLVFPSLCDGFGLVILEAMAQGLPVIATTNCAGPDVIADGVDGFVVPIRDPDSIADRLDRLASDPALLASMSRAALAKAALRSWDRYTLEMLDLIDTCLR